MMQLLLPDSESFVLEPYTGEDESVLSVHKAENGFVVETLQQGYAGGIIMMVGVDVLGARFIPEEFSALWSIGLKIASNVLVIILNYLLSKLIIFRKQKD